MAFWWRSRGLLALALLPLSWLFCLVADLRRLAYRRGWLHSTRVPVPVIVVGNITVGGAGKTPLVLHLIDLLRSLGHRPGVISRGYGARSALGPRPVTGDSDPRELGDEPVLVARRAACPVWVAPRRAEAARALLDQGGCDVLICDDGLQHYALQRDLEIALVDNRGLGNGLCLPAGPLRERAARLARVDAVVGNGTDWPGAWRMDLEPQRLVGVSGLAGERALDELVGERVHALAGIGSPARFFATLRGAGLRPLEHPLPDHHAFRPTDIAFDDGLAVLMTEKDAVKCAQFAGPQHWYLRVGARLDDDGERRLRELLRGLNYGQETARDPGLPPVPR